MPPVIAAAAAIGAIQIGTTTIGALLLNTAIAIGGNFLIGKLFGKPKPPSFTAVSQDLRHTFRASAAPHNISLS